MAIYLTNNVLGSEVKMYFLGPGEGIPAKFGQIM